MNRFDQRRRAVIALGAGAFAPSITLAPLSSFAQPGKLWRIGFLTLRARPPLIAADPIGRFPKGMNELGYVEGQNLAIEWRFADGDAERLNGLAAELVRLKVDVLVAAGPQAAAAAKRATTTLPIVMVVSNDPVASGLAASLARPGGNITGLANYSADLGPKQLEMLLAMVPKLTRVAVLVNPSNPSGAALLKNLEGVAPKAGVKLFPVQAGTPRELDTAFGVMAREKAGGVIVALDAFFIQQQGQIVQLAAQHRLPSISAMGRGHVESGALMSYGRNLFDQNRQLARFVDKIIKGAKPGEIPIEQPTTIELFINKKTAQALKLTIPQTLLISADKVIE